MQQVEHSIILDLLRGGVQASVNVKKDEVGARKITICMVNGCHPYYPGEDTTVQLRAVKPDGTELYNNALIDGAVATVNITSQMVASPGTVKAELSFTDENNNRLFSPRFDIIVEDCLYSDDAIESTNEYSALTSVISSVEVLEEKWSGATATAQSGATAGAQVTIGDEGVSFNFTLPKGDKGDAGVSVSVGTTTTGTAGTDASVTNSGTASDPVLNFTIPKGADGQNGADGQDGVSPVATVEQITGGARITVTDANGTTTQDVMNGQDGADGTGIPEGGTVGQVLSKTADGMAWADQNSGNVQTVDGISPDNSGNVDIGAAKADVFSRNGLVSLPSGFKGVDVRPFNDPEGISLGIGTVAPDTVNNVSIANGLDAALRGAIEAQSALTFPLSRDIGGTGQTAIPIIGNGTLDSNYFRTEAGYVTRFYRLGKMVFAYIFVFTKQSSVTYPEYPAAIGTIPSGFRPAGEQFMPLFLQANASPSNIYLRLAGGLIQVMGSTTTTVSTRATGVLFYTTNDALPN